MSDLSNSLSDDMSDHPFVGILEFIKDSGSLDQVRLARLEEHLARCKICANELETADRREWRRGLLLVDMGSDVEARSKIGSQNRRYRKITWISVIVSVWELAIALGVYVYFSSRNAELSNRKTDLEISISQLSDTQAQLERSNAELSNTKARLERSNGVKEGVIASQRTRLDAILREINALGLSRPPAVYDLRRVTANQIEATGEFDPGFIKEIRVRWGMGRDDIYHSVYKGAPEPTPKGERKRFQALSPEYQLSGNSITVSLEFVPYPDMSRDFPFFFRPDQMRYSRTFLLAKGGIAMDPESVTIVFPEEGRTVDQMEQFDGKLNTKDGWPVVLVRAVDDSEWWVQAPVAMTDHDFVTQLRVGRHELDEGSRFIIVVIVVKNKQAADEYRTGMRLRALPPNIPRSKYVTVVRKQR